MVQPSWYYAPNLDFPTNLMKPGFFLTVADNWVDGFSYEILPVANYHDIPKHGRLNTVIRSVVRKRILSDTTALIIREQEGSWIVTNRDGDPIGENYVSSHNDMQYFFSTSEEGIYSEHDQIAHPHITNETSLHQYHDENFHFDSLEEGTYYEDNQASHPHHTNEYLSHQHHDKNSYGKIIPTFSDQPSDVDNSPDEDIICPTIFEDDSATIPALMNMSHRGNDSDSGDDDDDVTLHPISQDSSDSICENINPIEETEEDLPNIAADINSSLDVDVNMPEITSVNYHQFNGFMLELQCTYDNGDTEWHPFDLVKLDDEYSVAKYVLANDLGKISNTIYRRWARALLRAMKRVIRRMK